jgi:microcystin degradation protein MlrC
MPVSRIFMGGIATETNSFSAVPTVLSDFQNGGLYHGDATQHPAAHFTAPLHCWRARASAAGHVVVEGLMAAAQPGGITTAKTWELLRNDLLESLRQAGDVDLILLNLHGGMIADGEFDCEGALLEDIRRMAPKAVIGCELDPHCHLTDRMVHNADVIVTYKAYPHTDIVDVAEDVWRAFSCDAGRDHPASGGARGLPHDLGVAHHARAHERLRRRDERCRRSGRHLVRQFFVTGLHWGTCRNWARACLFMRTVM